MNQTIDDLQEAEEHIAFLESIVVRFLDQPGGAELDALRADAQVVLDAGWCRPTCEDHPDDPGDCGCPCHRNLPHEPLAHLAVDDQPIPGQLDDEPLSQCARCGEWTYAITVDGTCPPCAERRQL